MKKNKTIAYALAATLLVGGTFAGTKAYFTDKEEASYDLVITMGNLNVDVKESEWKNLNDNTEAIDKKNQFTNVKPGDRFTKLVTVTNNGSLEQKLSVSGGEIISDIHGDLLTGETLSKLDGEILKPGETRKAVLDLVIPETVEGEFEDTKHLNLNEKPTFNFSELVAPFEINATQVK